MAKIKNPILRKTIMTGLITVGIGLVIWIVYARHQMREAVEEMDAARQGSSEAYDRYRSAMGSGQATSAYKLGERIDLGDRAITVFKFEPYSEPMMKRTYGAKGHAMEVMIENNSAHSFSLNPFHFTVQDQEGRPLEYYGILPGGKRPNLALTLKVASGQKIRGYITYVGETKPVVVYYNALRGQTAKIIVE